MISARSALVVPVPETEPVVGRHRAVLDPVAGWGVPAALTAAAADVAAALPARARIDMVHLFTGTAEPGGWRSVRVFPLGR